MTIEDIFVNARGMNEGHPESFGVPSADEPAGVAPGDAVKVCAGGERFWVAVTAVDGPEVVGSIDTVLLMTDEHGLNRGDTVRFGREHVYDLIKADAA
jgi:hypothetical protein